MTEVKERRLGPAVALLICLVLAYLWVGWQGPVIGLVTGTVMAIGTVYNRKQFLREAGGL